MVGSTVLHKGALMTKHSSLFKRLSCCILMLLLIGCAAKSAAPVVSIAPKTETIRGVHTVQKGESLFLIAWRYGRDYEEIAIANGIRHPYKIFPGQRLTLAKPSKEQIAKAEHVSPPKPLVKAKPKIVAKKEVPQPIKEPLKIKLSENSNKWLWPAQGKIVSQFNQKSISNKGIEIVNKKGTPIKATKPGKVVYSGEGLRGYGRLLIIKHDDEYLSAYAHNDALLVKEGQNVKQGQTIATMGRSDSNQVKLHFEIRKKGQPVDPLGYLPNDQG